MQIKTGFSTSYSSKNWIQIDSNLVIDKYSYNKPREWQSECYDSLIDHKGISIINAPTGSGKSTMISILGSAKLLKDDSIKLIIAVPQTIIGKGFSKKSILLPGDIPVDWDPGVQLCGKSSKNIDTLISWIKTPIFKAKERFQERILVCTHATLTAAFSKMDPDERAKHWKDIVVVVDEAHHVSIQETDDELTITNKLGEIINYIHNTQDKNNEAILITATFFRGDSKSLISNEIQESAKRYNLPFDVYISQMNHFESFSYDFVIDTLDYTKNIKECVDNLDATNHKKLVIYIPIRNTTLASDKNAEVTDIIQGLMDSKGATNQFIDKNGLIHITNDYGLDYKILDLVTVQNQKKSKAFFQKPIVNQDSNSLDCIITLNMFKEGADWEFADGMIITGKRNSLTDVIQMVGRLLRDKTGKSTVRVLHMLPYSIGNEFNDDLEDNLNSYFKAIAISLLMEEVFQPINISINKNEPKNDSSNEEKKSENSVSIYNELGLDENQISDLIEISIKDLVNFSQGIKESNGNYSNSDLKNKMSEIVKSWMEQNNIEFNEEQFDKLSDKVFNSLCVRDIKTNNLGINLLDIDWEMIESAEPINCILRYTGLPVDEEGLRQLRILIAKLEFCSNNMCHKVCQWTKSNGKKPSGSSKDVIEKKYGCWIQVQRKYKKNKSFYQSNQKIAESYDLPDLFEYKDREKESNEMCHLVCQWIKDNGKKPTLRSSDIIEKKYAAWINCMRSAKVNRGGFIFYQSNQEIINLYGYIDLFDVKSRNVKEMCHLVCQWIISNGRHPKAKSSDLVEKKYANFINTQKRVKQGPNFEQYKQDIVESYGLPDLFEDKIKNIEVMCHSVCQWIKDNDKKPTLRSTDIIEKKYAAWIDTQKRYKKSKNKDSIQEIAESYDLPDLFESKDREKESNEMCHKVCEWTKLNDKKPSTHSKDIIEKKYGTWIQTQKRSKKIKGNSVFYQSNQKIAESYGLHDLFVSFESVKPLDAEKESNKMCHLVCQWIKTNGKNPSGKSTDFNERKYCFWIQDNKKGKVNKSNYKFYISNQEIADSYGLFDLFEIGSTESREKKSNKMCHLVCEWIISNGMPKSTSKDAIEYKYASWINTQRQNKKEENKAIFYHSNQEIAESYGLFDLFVRKTKYVNENYSF